MDRAGKLLAKEDFDTMKLEKCRVDVLVLSGAAKVKRVFRAWREAWKSPENERTRKLSPCMR